MAWWALSFIGIEEIENLGCHSERSVAELKNPFLYPGDCHGLWPRNDSKKQGANCTLFFG